MAYYFSRLDVTYKYTRNIKEKRQIKPIEKSLGE